MEITIEEKKALKQLLEQIPLYTIMTNPDMIQMYIDHIQDEPLWYESDDEEAEKEQQIENLREVVEGRGKAILQELFAKEYINAFDGQKLVEFAKRFARSEQIMEWMYWLQVIIGYHTHLVMMYVFLDHEPKDDPQTDKTTNGNHNSKKKKRNKAPDNLATQNTTETSLKPVEQQKTTESTTSAEPVFKTWKEGLGWLANCFEKNREQRKRKVLRPKVVSVPFGGMNKRKK